MHPFERELSVSKQDIEIYLQSIKEIAWTEFLLNPRRLRGSDFLMRWSQGVWSEKRVIEAVNATKEFFAVPYGPSGTAPHDNVREFELYFERLEKAGLGNIKRPDLLIFNKKDIDFVSNFIKNIGGESELPFIKENTLQPLLKKAIVAIECENSLWVAEKMPAYGIELTPQRRLEGKLGLKSTAVAPTIIIKEEDLIPLRKWQDANNVPIHIWHVFYDKAYGISLERAEKLINDKLILPTKQTFQAPGGATTVKIIYKFYYHYGYSLGVSNAQPELDPAFIQDKNGHILPYIKFKGGSFTLTDEAKEQLKKLAK